LATWICHSHVAVLNLLPERFDGITNQGICSQSASILQFHSESWFMNGDFEHSRPLGVLACKTKASYGDYTVYFGVVNEQF